MRRYQIGTFILALGLWASSQALGQEAPGAKSLAVYFPQDVIFYIECGDIAGLRRDAESSGLWSLWKSSDMEAIRTSVEGAADEKADDNQNARIVRAFGDFAGGLSGGAAAAVFRRGEEIAWLAVVDVGSDTAGAKTFLDVIYAEEERAGRPSTEVEASGVKMRVSSVDAECSAIADGLVIVGTRGAVESLLADKAADSLVQPLSASVAFAKAMSFCSGQSNYRAYVDVRGLLEASKIPWPAAGGTGPDYLGEIDTVSLEGNFKSNGIVERVFVSTRQADSRLITMIGRAEFDDAVFRYVPKEALFSAGSGSDMRTSPADWRSIPFDIETGMKAVEERSGVSIERDILPHLVGPSFGYMKLPEGAAALPMAFMGEGSTFVAVDDEAAVSAAVDKLAECARANPGLFNPPSQVGRAAALVVETTTLGKLKVHYLSVKRSPQLSPSVAVYKGYLVYSNNKDNIVKAVDNLIAPGPSILESEDYKRVRSALPGKANQVAYISLDRLVDVFYDSVLPILVSQIEAAHTAGRIGFSASDIPPAYVVKKHLDGIGISLGAGGNLVEATVYSPTGFMPLAALALLAVASEGAVPMPAMSPPAEADAPTQRLVEIGRRLHLATIDRKGKFPDAITDAVAAGELQAPQDSAADSPADYVYVKGLTTQSPGRMILVYERDGLDAKGRRALFVDGSVELMTEEDFQALKEKQK
jgi:hypothetical protein